MQNIFFPLLFSIQSIRNDQYFNTLKTLEVSELTPLTLTVHTFATVQSSGQRLGGPAVQLWTCVGL